MSTTMLIYIYLWSLLNCVLGVLACSCAHVLAVFMCWRSWCACMLGILTYSRVWHVYIFTCLACLFVLFPLCSHVLNACCIQMSSVFTCLCVSLTSFVLFSLYLKSLIPKNCYIDFFFLFRGFGAHLNI